ncbi:MAG: hypothetical protein K2X66_05285 [Cyanobacteria bacterium]|nr:hypothetical protein [Cyanobacteriota bacterium]
MSKPFQIVLSIILFALLGSYTYFSITGLSETQDALVVQNVQKDLQQTISESSGRLGINGNALLAPNVINAVKSSIPPSVKLRSTGLVDTPYELIFKDSGRKVLFSVSNAGDVRIKGLQGFWTRFRQLNGFIKKN